MLPLPLLMMFAAPHGALTPMPLLLAYASRCRQMPLIRQRSFVFATQLRAKIDATCFRHIARHIDAAHTLCRCRYYAAFRDVAADLRDKIIADYATTLLMLIAAMLDVAVDCMLLSMPESAICRGAAVVCLYGAQVIAYSMPLITIR